jgi:divalent metal cation (Fe/Co/Zn/Cd) transporter
MFEFFLGYALGNAGKRRMPDDRTANEKLRDTLVSIAVLVFLVSLMIFVWQHERTHGLGSVIRDATASMSPSGATFAATVGFTILSLLASPFFKLARLGLAMSVCVLTLWGAVFLAQYAVSVLDLV